MWLISDYTFNTLYASTQLTLREIVDMDPDVTIMLQRSRPGKKKKSYEVQRIKVNVENVSPPQKKFSIGNIHEFRVTMVKPYSSMKI